MREGNIRCSCGQEIYFKTAQTKVKCPNPKCGIELDVSCYPVIPEPPIEEGDPDGIVD